MRKTNVIRGKNGDILSNQILHMTVGEIWQKRRNPGLIYNSVGRYFESILPRIKFHLLQMLPLFVIPLPFIFKGSLQRGSLPLFGRIHWHVPLPWPAVVRHHIDISTSLISSLHFFEVLVETFTMLFTIMTKVLWKILPCLSNNRASDSLNIADF